MSATLAPILDAIPAFLLPLTRWVMWQVVVR
jgi:hypothetical protein